MPPSIKDVRNACQHGFFETHILQCGHTVYVQHPDFCHANCKGGSTHFMEDAKKYPFICTGCLKAEFMNQVAP